MVVHRSQVVAWKSLFYRLVNFLAAIGEVLVCSRKRTNVGEIFIVKLNSRKKFSYIFCVRKYLYNETKAKYGKTEKGNTSLQTSS